MPLTTATTSCSPSLPVWTVASPTCSSVKDSFSASGVNSIGIAQTNPNVKDLVVSVMGSTFQPFRRREWVAEEPGGVLVGDAAHVVAGHAGEALAEQRLRVGPRRVGVRVVGLHHDVVDTDALARVERR